MKPERLIPLTSLYDHYNLEQSFFVQLNEMGLLEILTVDENDYINSESIFEIERMIRLHQDLEVNMEAIDIVLTLLHKIRTLQEELVSVKNRLRLYDR